MDKDKAARGRVLQVKQQLSGMSQVVVDNGPFRTLTLHTRTEDLSELLAADPQMLLEHFMTRKPGHFRRKSGK